MEEIDPAALSHLIGDIYDCALDPSLWPQALEDAATHFDAKVTSIFAIEPLSSGIVFAQMWGQDPSVAAADAEKYNPVNPFITAGWHSQIDEPFCLRSVMDPQEFRCTRFYKEFMITKGWFDFVGATLQKSAQRYTAMSAALAEEQGEATERQLEIMRLLAPHVRRALTIQETLDFKDRRLFDLRGALDLAPSPIFLLDERGELQEANRAAERFLAEEKAARIARGHLFFTDAGVAAQVAVALAAAVRGETKTAATAALQMASGRAFAMDMLPLTRPLWQAASASSRAVLALFLQEVGALQPLPGEVLVKLYGLTPAETRLLVLLAQAMTLREAADTLGAGKATVKSHLQSVFEKTGTRRQAEAVKLVLSALPRR